MITQTESGFNHYEIAKAEKMLRKSGSSQEYVCCIKASNHRPGTFRGSYMLPSGDWD